ncbi:MAG: hypothetical protein IT269_13950 [Saprospiraceae bacterium]|nr:hypothetical protein [Saprospiraceae bacterium]
MNILIAAPGHLSAPLLDDQTRVLKDLGKTLIQTGHRVTFLAPRGSVCDFATVIDFDPKKTLQEQIPENTDLLHLVKQPEEALNVPVVITAFNHAEKDEMLHPNTVFVSERQAQQYGSDIFIHPGLEFDSNIPINLKSGRTYLHFLGNAARTLNNIKGAIEMAGNASMRLHIIGEHRFNFRQGLRSMVSTTARYHGALLPDGQKALLSGSKGLVFPILWQKPFALPVIESFWMGCPAFGTPYGALPEILGKKMNHGHINGSKDHVGHGEVEAFYSDFGMLSNKKSEILEAIKGSDFDPRLCHEYAGDMFSIQRMADQYLKVYQQILNGRPLHQEPPVTHEDWDKKSLPLFK